MTPEDQHLFRQFKRFYKQYYETHGHDAPSHQLTRDIIQQMFPGLPFADADTIAKARAELLAAERLKELCKQLGLAVPTQLQEYPPPSEAPEYPPLPRPPQFLSIQDKERMAAQQQLLAEAEETETKPDVKPRRLATSYLGPPVYRDKGTPSKKGGGSSFTVTKLPSSLELKGQRPLSLPHSP